MKVLLDTHAFIWWDSAPNKLSPKARAACEDRENLLLLSVASAWEIQIKLMLDKLDLRLALAELIAGQQQTNDLQVLPVALSHVFALQGLPAHHKDPFDRLLIAQANAEEATLIRCHRANRVGVTFLGGKLGPMTVASRGRENGAHEPRRHGDETTDVDTGTGSGSGALGGQDSRENRGRHSGNRTRHGRPAG